MGNGLLLVSLMPERSAIVEGAVAGVRKTTNATSSCELLQPAHRILGQRVRSGKVGVVRVHSGQRATPFVLPFVRRVQSRNRRPPSLPVDGWL